MDERITSKLNFNALYFLAVFCFINTSFHAAKINKTEPIDSTFNKKIFINGSLIGSAAISYAGFYHLWYKGYDQTSFHSFNDLEEWQYMDKVGHLCTSYHLNKFSYNLLKNNGIEKPLLKSSIYSFTYMAGIEILDGFSEEWGFSWYDIMANGLGNVLFTWQEHKFKDQLVSVKFSSHMTDIANCRPSLLGSSRAQRIFKDYNGQTYWLTLDVNKTLKSNIKVFQYLDLAVGYTINGFTGARENPFLNCTTCNNLERKSSILLSLDLNLKKWEGKSRFTDAIIHTFNVIKFPMPTIIIDNKIQYKWLYF